MGFKGNTKEDYSNKVEGVWVSTGGNIGCFVIVKEYYKPEMLEKVIDERINGRLLNESVNYKTNETNLNFFNKKMIFKLQFSNLFNNYNQNEKNLFSLFSHSIYLSLSKFKKIKVKALFPSNYFAMLLHDDQLEDSILLMGNFDDPKKSAFGIAVSFLDFQAKTKTNSMSPLHFKISLDEK